MDETTTSTIDIQNQLAAPPNAVKVLNMTDDIATVGGYGVVFGGVDLEGETFEKDTDYFLDWVPVKPIFYEHSKNEKVSHKMGIASKEQLDDVGIWVEAELDRHAEYMDAVLKLVEAGALGWSSGTAGHLARREKGIIKSWPVIEYSLTPTPAEPRTLGVELIKKLAEADETLKAFLPEGNQEIASVDATGGDAEPVEDTDLEKTTCQKTKVRLRLRL